MRSLSYSLILLLTVSLAGCDGGLTDLDVENKENPDRERALSDPADVETIASGTWTAFFRGTEGYNQIGGVNSWSPSFSVSVNADVHTASWGNFSMQDHGREPDRPAWDNSSGYTYAHVNEQAYFEPYSSISNAVDALAAIESLGRETFNSELEGANPAARIEAFSNFNMAMAYLYLGSRFDKAALIDETEGFQGEEFVPYPQVIQFGVQKMDRVIEISNNNDFTIPAGEQWFWNTGMSSTELAALANSMKAKYASLSARTPAERQDLSHLEGIGWQDIYDWVDAGMESTGYSGAFAPVEGYPGNPAGFLPVGNLFPQHWDSMLFYGTSVPESDTWARADYKTIGPANTAEYDDGTNKYDQWKQSLQDDPNDLQDDIYLTESPDRRVVGGTDPACGDYVEQGRAGFEEGSCGDQQGATLEHAGDGKYLGFRGTVTEGADGLVAIPFTNGPFPPSRGRWHYSDRAHDRFLAWRRPGGFSGAEEGPVPHTLKAEMDLLKAEAMLHGASGSESVADLIDITRVENGELPSAAGAPQGSMEDEMNPLLDRGATLWSMLKYERVLETWNSSSGVNWMIKRGWGDLKSSAMIQYPLPGQELNTLGEANYTFGGPGGPCSQGSASGTTPSECTPQFGGGNGGSSIVLDENYSRSSRSTSEEAPTLPFQPK